MVLIRRLAPLLAASLLLGACSQRAAFPHDAKRNVVAAFYPLAEAARRVGGRDVRVVDLTPPNVEPHDLELTTRQVDRIEDADLVILLGGHFQPAVTRAARRAKGRVLTIPAPNNDPHVWLDPFGMEEVVDDIADALAGVPGASSRADDFKAELTGLHVRYRDGLADCARRTLVTSHEAFGHLARRYRLTQTSAAGVSPEAEPDPRAMARLADAIRRTGTTTVFTEQLASPKVARALARSAGVKTDVLDPLESGQPGAFVPVMNDNLSRIRAALGCR